MEWERLYTVNDSHDGPLLGVTDFKGAPHIYEGEFSAEDDEYTGRFMLAKIEPQLFVLVMEDWEIWLRWRSAFDQGKATIDTHPALPKDRQRHTELKQLIGDRLHATPENSLVRRAEFRRRDDNQLEVRWHDPNAC
jgi:hypothetical protein